MKKPSSLDHFGECAGNVKEDETILLFIQPDWPSSFRNIIGTVGHRYRQVNPPALSFIEPEGRADSANDDSPVGSSIDEASTFHCSHSRCSSSSELLHQFYEFPLPSIFR